MTSTPDHIRLYIPGPIEVRKEILEAQTAWMIGHRSTAFADLYARLQPKLQQAFFTQSPVYVFTSSGTGIWESASRNCIRDDSKVLHLVCGAFSKRWAEVSQLNGKTVDKIEVPMGQAILPEQLEEALKKGQYDAVATVYNETSTGVLNPISEYAQIL
jgi:aspartate aminotransferase-like enzyme